MKCIYLSNKEVSEDKEQGGKYASVPLTKDLN
jgi:hypothetical protein